MKTRSKKRPSVTLFSHFFHFVFSTRATNFQLEVFFALFRNEPSLADILFLAIFAQMLALFFSVLLVLTLTMIIESLSWKEFHYERSYLYHFHERAGCITNYGIQVITFAIWLFAPPVIFIGVWAGLGFLMGVNSFFFSIFALGFLMVVIRLFYEIGNFLVQMARKKWSAPLVSAVVDSDLKTKWEHHHPRVGDTSRLSWLSYKLHDICYDNNQRKISLVEGFVYICGFLIYLVYFVVICITLAGATNLIFVVALLFIVSLFFWAKFNPWQPYEYHFGFLAFFGGFYVLSLVLGVIATRGDNAIVSLKCLVLVAYAIGLVTNGILRRFFPNDYNKINVTIKVIVWVLFFIYIFVLMVMFLAVNAEFLGGKKVALIVG